MAFRLANPLAIFAKDYLTGTIGLEGTKVVLECHSIRMVRKVMIYDETGDGDGGVPQLHEGMVHTTLFITGVIGVDDATGLANVGNSIGSVSFQIDQGRKYAGSYVIEELEITIRKSKFVKRTTAPIRLVLRNTSVAVTETDT